MTEKEAIEILVNDESYITDSFYREFRTIIADRYTRAFRLVLKALEQKDKEIAELKAKYDRDTHTLQNKLDVANADRIEKDKIINEMAEHIVSSAIVDDTVCAIKCDCDINEDCSYEKMLKCTKQYFERKVRNNYE